MFSSKVLIVITDGHCSSLLMFLLFDKHRVLHKLTFNKSTLETGYELLLYKQGL